MQKKYVSVIHFLILFVLFFSVNTFSAEKEKLNHRESNLPEFQTSDSIKTWNGFSEFDSTLNGIPFKVVFPKTANKNHDWIWRARFWGHEPQTDIALLETGFHLVYIEVGGLFGCEKAIKIWDDFYAFATQKYNLNDMENKMKD